MDTVLDYAIHKRKIQRNRADRIDPVIAEIIDALISLGGEAHRGPVADRVAGNRAGYPLKASDGLAQEVFQAFETYLEAANGFAARQPLLTRPFGDDSHRWALTHAGTALFAERFNRSAGH